MAKAIREASGKEILAKYLKTLSSDGGSSKGLTFPVRSATVTPETDLAQLARNTPWLESEVRTGQGLVFYTTCTHRSKPHPQTISSFSKEGR